MKRLSFAFLMFVFLGSVGYAQRAPGTITITGRISGAVQLALRREWQSSNQQASDLRIVADSTSVNSVEIILTGSEKSTPAEVAVPLEMRTNEGYELRLMLISTEGSAPPMFVSISSLRASGPLVAPKAAEVTRQADSIELARCLSPVTTLRGNRISMRGNFTTPTNALLADLKLAVSPGGATPGRWRAVFRVSLHPSL